MKNSYIILISFFGLLFSSESTNAQTITKSVDKTSVYIGEEFTYAITVDNVSSLSSINTIVDDFGQNVDILSVDYGNTLDLLITWGICSLTQNTSANNELTITFPNCTGAPIGGTLSFNVTVRLNQSACNLTKYNNTAQLNLSNNTTINSNNTSVSIDNSNPFVLQKSYFKYNASSEEIYYDVRLSSKSGNFLTLQNGTELFQDIFTIPSCFQNITANDIEVVYIPDENNRSSETAIPHYTQIIGNQLIAEWQLPPGIQNTNESSLLYVVKIKLQQANCQCTTSYNIKNEAEFKYDNVCNTQYTLQDSYTIQKGSNFCDFNSGMPGGGNGTPSSGLGTGTGGNICELDFSKSYQLDGNDMGLTMKGCKGKYLITVRNCSDSLVYKGIKIKDLVPTELQITGINHPGFTMIDNGNQLDFYRDRMLPGEAYTLEVGFIVTTNLQDHTIKNCADIDLDAENQYNSNQKQLTNTFCTSFKTVPNKVTVITRKSICSKPSQSCGFAKDNYLPDDEVEYELFFYNYGSADGTNVTIEDRLPRYFDLQSITVYKNQSGSSARREPCNLDEYKDITNDVVINRQRRTNNLKIDLKNHILDAFTCKGVSFYKIRIKGKIESNVVNGQYRNQFVVDFKDQSLQTNVQEVSNMAPYTVNLDNFIMIDKLIVNEQSDCDNHTQKITYQVKVYNLGNTNVNVDIEDFIPNINNVNIIQGPHNFKSCLQIGPPSPNLCIPTTTLANINGTWTNLQNGFRLIKQETYPCTLLVIEYDVLFDTRLLTNDEVVEACNQLKVWAYTGRVRIRHDSYKKNPIAYPNNIVVNSQPELNAMFLNAKTAEEQRYVMQLVKAYKTNPKSFALPNNFNKVDALGNIPGLPSLDGQYFGIDEKQECADLKDCLKEFPSECINSTGTSDIKLEILGINLTTGEISTRLTNNTSNRIAKVEYILTDVVHKEVVCEPIYIGPRPLKCNTCTGNITGNFRPKDNTPLVTLNLNSNNFNGIAATYKEQNTVVYGNIGATSSITTVDKNFMFPIIKNCSGYFEFTITTIVYFENCDACIATDAIDFRTSYQPLIYNPNLNNTGHPIQFN